MPSHVNKLNVTCFSKVQLRDKKRFFRQNQPSITTKNERSHNHWQNLQKMIQLYKLDHPVTVFKNLVLKCSNVLVSLADHHEIKF